MLLAGAPWKTGIGVDAAQLEGWNEAEVCAEEVAARREMLHEGRCGSIGKQLRAEVPLRRVIGKKKHLSFQMNKI